MLTFTDSMHILFNIIILAIIVPNVVSKAKADLWLTLRDLSISVLIVSSLFYMFKGHLPNMVDTAMLVIDSLFLYEIYTDYIDRVKH